MNQTVRPVVVGANAGFWGLKSDCEAFTREKCGYPGEDIEAFDLVLRYLNIDYQFQSARDMNWSGTIDGELIGFNRDIVDGVIDLTVPYLYFTSDAIMGVDYFSSVLNWESFAFAINRETAGQHLKFRWYKVFTPEVWVIFLSWMFARVFLNLKNPRYRPVSFFYRYLGLYFGIMLSKTLIKHRVAVVSYPFESVSEAANAVLEGLFTLVCDTDTFSSFLFKESPTVFGILANALNKRPPKILNNYSEIYGLIEKDPRYFTIDTYEGLVTDVRDYKNLLPYKIDGTDPTFMIGIVRKGFPLKRKVSNAILYVLSTGLPDQIYRMYRRPTFQNAKVIQTKAVPLSFSNMYLIFMFVLFFPVLYLFDFVHLCI